MITHETYNDTIKRIEEENKIRELQKNYDKLLEYHLKGRYSIKENDDGSIDVCYGHHDKNEDCEWIHYKRDKGDEE